VADVHVHQLCELKSCLAFAVALVRVHALGAQALTGFQAVLLRQEGDVVGLSVQYCVGSGGGFHVGLALVASHGLAQTPANC
jgi:hypothetical protein